MIVGGMNSTTATPCYVSLNRLAQLSGRSRVTLLLRVKDGKLPPDALLDLGNGKSLPQFFPHRAAQLRRGADAKIATETIMPDASPDALTTPDAPAATPHPLM